MVCLFVSTWWSWSWFGLFLFSLNCCPCRASVGRVDLLPSSSFLSCDMMFFACYCNAFLTSRLNTSGSIPLRITDNSPGAKRRGKQRWHVFICFEQVLYSLLLATPSTDRHQIGNWWYLRDLFTMEVFPTKSVGGSSRGVVDIKKSTPLSTTNNTVHTLPLYHSHPPCGTAWF